MGRSTCGRLTAKDHTGTYRIPVLRGEVDTEITLHSKVEETVARDLESWLGNLYLEARRLPRETYKVEGLLKHQISGICRGMIRDFAHSFTLQARGGGQEEGGAPVTSCFFCTQGGHHKKDHDVEYDHVNKLLNLGSLDPKGETRQLARPAASQPPHPLCMDSTLNTRALEGAGGGGGGSGRGGGGEKSWRGALRGREQVHQGLKEDLLGSDEKGAPARATSSAWVHGNDGDSSGVHDEERLRRRRLKGRNTVGDIEEGTTRMGEGPGVGAGGEGSSRSSSGSSSSSANGTSGKEEEEEEEEEEEGGGWSDEDMARGPVFNFEPLGEAAGMTDATAGMASTSGGGLRTHGGLRRRGEGARWDDTGLGLRSGVGSRGGLPGWRGNGGGSNEGWWPQLTSPEEMKLFRYAVASEPGKDVIPGPGAVIRQKIRYLRQEILADLRPRNYQSLECWLVAFLWASALWMRMYLHFVGQWALLTASGVPVFGFSVR
ncbi:unnamed protein product, partial [Discosporangium mesarthrocarpum]